MAAPVLQWVLRWALQWLQMGLRWLLLLASGHASVHSHAGMEEEAADPNQRQRLGRFNSDLHRYDQGPRGQILSEKLDVHAKTEAHTKVGHASKQTSSTSTTAKTESNPSSVAAGVSTLRSEEAELAGRRSSVANCVGVRKRQLHTVRGGSTKRRSRR